MDPQANLEAQETMETDKKKKPKHSSINHMYNNKTVHDIIWSCMYVMEKELV